MKYLGIDYGKRKVGLAISEGQVASIFGILEISSLKDGVDKVYRIIKKEEIDRVVTGVPEGGDSRKITKNFIKSLRLKLKEETVELIETDETLTSIDAKRLMVEMDISRRKREDEDAYSAALILQEFLNSLN
jgi:putative Holliday junction resolvase